METTLDSIHSTAASAIPARQRLGARLVTTCGSAIHCSATRRFPVYVGALLWAGLYLRDDRVRRLLAAR